MLLKRALDPVGGVKVARGVAKERIDSDSGVVAARSVALKRPCPQTGVALRRSNPRQRERENERNHKDGEKRSSVGRIAKHIIPSLFVDEGQNVGDKNIGVELDGVRHDAGGLSLISLYCNQTPIAPAPGYCRFFDIGRFDLTC